MYKILIVEDDRVIADKMKEHLEKWDYEVSVNNEFDVPHWDMTIMDNWELMIGN